MRPRRIARRFIARARHWGVPHVHCPSCGADGPVPIGEDVRVCFTCHIRWFRVQRSGDDAADLARVRARALEEGGREGRYAVTWSPLLIDAPGPGGGKRSETLPCAFVYLLGRE